RDTILSGDWSSDVCSSDLIEKKTWTAGSGPAMTWRDSCYITPHAFLPDNLEHQFGAAAHRHRRQIPEGGAAGRAVPAGNEMHRRSEERRVGKVMRTRWQPC